MNYDIVFREIPDETTLAINISNCPNRCKGCHSPYLMEDKGKLLDENVLCELLEKYGNAITCICFMGGDASPREVERLALFLKQEINQGIKIGWYSGKQDFPTACNRNHFDFIKLGPYIEKLGGLDSPTTNQHLYLVDKGKMIDITYRFRGKIRP